MGTPKYKIYPTEQDISVSDTVEKDSLADEPKALKLRRNIEANLKSSDGLDKAVSIILKWCNETPKKP